jgi:hypothetical protein
MRNSATAATGAVALVMALANPWPLLAQDAKSKSSAPAAKPMVLMVKAVPARAVTLST